MRQLTGVDASFLSWESPTTVGHVTSVVMIDPASSPEPWTFERWTDLLRSRLDRLEIFTQKLFEVPLGLDYPYWIPDPDFDLDYHVRHIAVPGDRDHKAFADLVARIHERPLDRRRPLWECYVVDGLADGHKALITKLHHAAIDGMSGQEILANLVDLSPDVPVPSPTSTTTSDQTDQLADSPTDSGLGHSALTTNEVLGRATLSLLSSPSRLMKAGVTLAKAIPVVGPGMGRAGPAARGDEGTRELLRRFGSAPRTPFNATIGPHRRWAYASVPLDDIKAIKNAADTTVNDVVLALVGGVLRRWLLERDALPDRPLAAMVPLSVRSDSDAASGNQVASTIATLATQMEDPRDRLAAVKASMDGAKKAHDAMPADILTDLAQVAPPAVAALAARLVASTKLADRVTLPFNLVVSNVPGPPIPLYLAGALVVGHYPVSTIVDGAGLNVTVLSTNGMLDFGFVADRDLIDDLWPLAEDVSNEVATLAAAFEL